VSGRKVLPIRWKAEREPGRYTGLCPGCGSRLVRWHGADVLDPDGNPPLPSLERGFEQGSNGVYRRSGRHAALHPVRSRTLARVRVRAERLGLPMTSYGSPEARGPAVPWGTIVHCPKPTCDGWATVDQP
jgi:hypothetical protein